MKKRGVFLKNLIRCKDCPNYRYGNVYRGYYCIAFEWNSEPDDGCTFMAEDDEEVTE